MKKIAILLHGLGANGIDTLFANLSKKWDYEKYEITYLMAVDESAKQFWEDEVTANGVRVVHLHDLDKGRLKKWPLTLYKAFKKYGPFDAVHVNMDMLNGLNLMVAKYARIPVRVCHAHSSSSENAGRRVKQAYIALMRKMIRHYATECVACSDEAGEYFFPNTKYVTVFNGIDIDKYRKNEVRQEKISNTFVTVGRFTPQKNPFFLLDVFCEISNRLPNARLRWIGTGQMFERVKEKAEEYGVSEKIDFMGTRSDVDEILKQSDYFLFPSLSEGFGIALVEAQAADLDCFVSATVPMIADCGKCKFISLEKTPSEWAEEIVAYIQGDCRMEIMDELLSQFDIEQMARKLEVLYSK